MTLRSLFRRLIRLGRGPTIAPVIPPALTREEWAEALATGRINPREFLGIEEGQVVTRRQGHAAAALFLFGQPFGFTHRDVRALRESAEDEHAASQHAARLRSIADRIVAMLP